ncbi:CRISPR-associated RAMP protein [Actinomyces sp. ICM58]|uniref:RAMP superfamily CRISPR-associated protein n=1 Tax=Actinomyces sp. ICM58 TaxID=1105030 RepID=UPI0002771822|nr:RAMP superfamily CRISPR-associated protein [Actinomyces sp. ICM58]EJN53125.1 CRISPR-associated RAMP protein [Actinomyces sp. ICM58]
MTFTRYELTIPVELTSELHIGGVDAVPDRDGEGTVIRFCRNGLDEPTIPGRSIRGAVRAACDVARQALADAKNPTTQKGEAFSKESWISLWGDDSLDTGKSLHDRRLRSDDSLPIRQSALTFHAVSFPQYKDSDSGDSPLPRRHGVGIDRTTGAASDGALYEHEFLPRGTRFTIRITAEGRDDESMENKQSEGIPGPASSEAIELLLRLIRSLFKSKAISLGGRTGSGQGAIKVQESNEEHQDSDDQYLRIVAKSKGLEGERLVDVVDPLTGALTEGPESSKGTDSSACVGTQPARIKITWWSPTGIFVAEDEELTKQRKAAKEAENEEKGINEEVHEVVYPLRDPSVEWENAQLLIPGTSIRGALRSRASRIARTVLAAQDKLPTFTSHDLHEQIAAEPNLVRYMFGSTEYRGAVTVHDCLSTKRGKRIEVTHNAIDRWTGGVIDGGLFTEAVYLGTKWEPIRIDIDLRQLLNNIEAEKGPEAKRGPADAAEAEHSSLEREQPKPTHADYAHAAYVLLGLVLAELSAGTLPLGSRSTRGLGQVVVSTIEVEGADRKGVDLPSRNFTGCEALQQPETGAGAMTDALYEGQRKLAEQVLKHLKDKYEETDWSKRLENGPGAARKQSEGMGAADD